MRRSQSSPTRRSFGKNFGRPPWSVVTRPVFIIGTGWCGTSVLVRILRSHRQITVYPTEANELWHPKSYPYSKATIQTPPMLIDPQLFTKLSLNNWPHNHAGLIKKVFTCFHMLKGASTIFIVKSVMLSFMIPKILSIFPCARFVHLYRNGIVVARSLFKKEWKQYAAIINNQEDFQFYCAEYWKHCITEIDRVSEFLSLREREILYELSYEDLCSDPRKQLEGLVNFLGCQADGFRFNLSQVRRAPVTVANYTQDPKWFPIVKALSSVMKQKGYCI